jgi:mannose-6-phosphate isomerase-like protein (cupin superfamily)
MRIISVLTVFAVASLLGAAASGIARWSGVELRGYEKKLAPKINAQKVALESLAKYDNHSVMIVHRAGDGEAEIHENQVDVFVCQTGEAALIIGGSVIGGKTTAPGEIRGTSIQGGQKMKLTPGDIVHIPIQTAHQVMVEKGKQFTYVIVKVDSK